ncbi:MAG: DNA mismatch repair endonuclease MutL [Phycisphaeraceae bacterium]|nr:DNA mismatch repair endonuclease MutL [Phycisphaeraceae bacterium]MCB9847341.1 DNA mismatch repair endonuclease MutL [Phycisphaeraceae bacterium]
MEVETPETTRRTGQAPEIRTLAPLLVNQIAAGEVVERPASVVKELVDNAIDARATRIRVDLEDGGIELVRVTDDGVGVGQGQLLKALEPHATSKIREAADLDSIATMGFRGEALASIASVSRMTLRSRTRDEQHAASLSCEGDVFSDVRPEAGPVGTAVTVRNLFFNTPARRKFLRTPRTEQMRCAEIVRDLAIAHPAIGFVLTIDGETRLDLPPGQGVRDRAIAVLGREFADQLLELTADEFDDARGMTLWGLAGLPEIARPTIKGQHVFINGRPVRDRTIQHALQEAYRGLIEPSRKPTAVLMLEMDPSAVDVNVHPAKAEVRFRDASMIRTVILRAVRAALSRADLTPRWGGPHGDAPRGANHNMYGAGAGSGVSAWQLAETLRSINPQHLGSSYDIDALRAAIAPSSVDTSQDEPAMTLPTPVRRDPVLQVHNSFLITQDEQGVVIIDQHALHERVMFEKLLARISRGKLPSQRLLTPVVIDASAARIEALERSRELLDRLGFEADAMGPETIGLHAYPGFLDERRVEPREFLEDFLDHAEKNELGGDNEDALRDILDMMSCKAAVKAGDNLTPQELEELLLMREQVERSSNCPHGRPTTIRLTIRELERRFGRG